MLFLSYKKIFGYSRTLPFLIMSSVGRLVQKACRQLDCDHSDLRAESILAVTTVGQIRSALCPSEIWFSSTLCYSVLYSTV